MFVEISFHPREELANRRVVAGGCFVNNELRLPAGTLERHHRGSRNVGGGFGAEIASHEVKTQIET